MGDSTQNTPREWVAVEFRRSLATLAAPYEQQLELVPKGACLACELAGESRDFGRVFLGNESELTSQARHRIEELVSWLEELDRSDEWRCWDESVVRDGARWQRTRELARAILESLDT